MTESRHHWAAPLRVCLLHNYRESEQISMKLYAERLGASLTEEGLTVRHLLPPTMLSSQGRSFWAGKKLDSYAGRFLYYPHAVRSMPPSDVYHIVDHGHAHLLRSLDPRRTVITCHDLMLLVLASGRLGRRLVSGVALEVFRQLAGTLRGAAAVIADSAQTRRDLVQFADVDPARIEVIFPGMNQPFARDPAARDEGRRRWGLEGCRVVLQVGNAFYKNLEGSLRIIARLRRRGVDVHFLRGGLRLTPEQRQLATGLGIADFVRDLGPLPDRELSMLYNAADVLLYPSLYEGFGWPPLEAMACGTPVVCSRAGSLAEVVGPAALTADPEDEERLADHVAAVLSDVGLAAGLREHGLRHAATFAWSRAAREVAGLYQRVRESA
ncbi:MAG: glycosyltransferase family 1 protein [Polyangia bacterium]